MKFLSAAIIAKDAEDHIARTIESVRDIADEVVLVLDSRTSDRTEEFARKAAGDKLRLLVRDWNHSFSDARNASLDMCEGQWVMFLDADDELKKGDGDALLSELHNTDADLVTCPIMLDASYTPSAYWDAGFGDFCSKELRNRVVRKSAGGRYFLRVHETLRFPGPFKFSYSDAAFYHRGRRTEDKADYYEALLQLDYHDDPSAPIPAIYLSEGKVQRRDPVRAARYLTHLDPADFDGGPIASRYWEVRGKVCQCAWAKTAEAHRPKVELAHEAAGCYAKAIQADPDRWQPYVNRAIVCFFGLGHAGADVACETLRALSRNDPDNITAREMLALAGAHEGDDLLTRLKMYLSAKAEEERQGMKKGWSPKVATVSQDELAAALGGRNGAVAGGRKVGV